jgi:hypothetical protein
MLAGSHDDLDFVSIGDGAADDGARSGGDEAGVLQLRERNVETRNDAKDEAQGGLTLEHCSRSSGNTRSPSRSCTYQLFHTDRSSRENYAPCRLYRSTLSLIGW